MTIYQVLTGYLLSVPEIAALAGTQIHPDALPPRFTGRAIVFRRVDSRPVYGMRGRHGWVTERWQFEVWTDDRGDAEELGTALSDALHAMRGERIGETDGIFVGDVRLRGDVDAIAREPGKSVRIMDFDIQHEG